MPKHFDLSVLAQQHIHRQHDLSSNLSWPCMQKASLAISSASLSWYASTNSLIWRESWRGAASINRMCPHDTAIEPQHCGPLLDSPNPQTSRSHSLTWRRTDVADANAAAAATAAAEAAKKQYGLSMPACPTLLKPARTSKRDCLRSNSRGGVEDDCALTLDCE